MAIVDHNGAPPSSRRPSPRPHYWHPQLIRRADAAHHVWGDAEAGFVTDRIIVSTDQLHVLEYELPPGGGFRHSAQNQTVFGGDVLYFVVEGELVLTDPQTGEVVRCPADAGRLFHRGTWHNAFNPFASTVRVVEFFSPPPARGTASDFAKQQPPLDESRFSDQRWAARWPEARDEQRARQSFLEASTATALWAFRDTRPSHLLATLVDTPYLHVVQGEVLPGHLEELKTVKAESLLLVTEGELWVDVWSDEIGFQATAVLQPGDAMFLPRGSSERVLNRRDNVGRYLKGSGNVPEGWQP